MASSRASTVAAYLRELPPDRRKALTAVRLPGQVVLEDLPLDVVGR